MCIRNFVQHSRSVVGAVNIKGPFASEEYAIIEARVVTTQLGRKGSGMFHRYSRQGRPRVDKLAVNVGPRHKILSTLTLAMVHTIVCPFRVKCI